MLVARGCVSLPSWPFVMRACVSGVRVIDGLMVFTRMPNGPSSAAAARASDTPPPLLALYTEVPGCAISARIEPLNKIAPLLCAFIWAASALRQKNEAFRLVAITLSKAASSTASNNSPPPPTPALLNAQSRRPQVETTCAIAAAAAPATVRSPCMKIASPPPAVISSTTASPSAALRPVIAILVSSVLFIGASPAGQLGHHSQGSICYYLSLL